MLTAKIGRGVQVLTRWIICVLLLTGCSKPSAKSTEAPLPELTEEQVKQVSNINKQYLDVQNIANWGSRDVFRGMEQTTLTNSLKDCETDHSRPTSDIRSLPTRGYFYSIFDGDLCPIQLSHRTGYRVSEMTGVGHVDVSLEYSIPKETFRKRFSLQSYEIMGRLEVLKQKSETQISGRLKGTLHSKQGSIPLVFDVLLQDGVRFYRSWQSVRMQFDGFIVMAEAERTRQNEKSTEIFKLNNHIIDRDSFERVIGAFLPTNGPVSF